MVLTWNDAPSTTQNGAVPPILPTATHVQVLRFNETTSRVDRVPTHWTRSDTQFLSREHVLSNAKAALEMAEHMEKQLWCPPAMKSERAKSATNKTLLSNDVRFEVLRDSTGEEVGPGTYWIEGGQPGLGPLPNTISSRSASPGKDPSRQSRAFSSPMRGELFQLSEAPDRQYLSSEYQPAHPGPMVPWSCTLGEPQRAEVQDYRWLTRVNDAARQVPINSDYPASSAMDQASKLTRIADTAARSGTETYNFRTKEARLSRLPKERLADTRLGRPRSDEDPAAHGPGTYQPLISLGAARRKTYRLFAAPQANGTIATAMPSRAIVSHQPSSSFASTPRGRPSGPYTWAVDSSLTKVY